MPSHPGEPRRPAASPLRRLSWRLLPGHCVLCDLPSGLERDLCLSCEGLLEPVPAPCPRCALPGAAMSPCACGSGPEPWPVPATLAPLAYRGATARLLQDFKNRADRAAGRVLCGPLIEGLTPLLHRWEQPPCLVPVPQSRRRTLQRGFDPVRWLAGELGAALGLPVRRAWVRRRARSSQRGLGRRLRLANLRGAYRGTGRTEPGSPVLLVDDVITTGATLAAVAAVLRAAGAVPVGACALARTLPD